MGFNYKYTKRLDRGNHSNYKYGEKKSLLEFFGFTYITEESPYTQTVWINDSDYLGGKRRISNTEYDRYEGYCRYKDPTGKEKELEDWFVAEMGSSFDPMEAGYLPTSVSEYYASLSFPGENEAGLGCGFGGLLSIAWILLGQKTLPLFERLTGGFFLAGVDITGPAWLVLPPIVICLITLAIGGIIQSIRRNIHGVRTPYHKLSKEELERYRQDYLNKLLKSHRGAAGTILKEYAILKGYDKIEAGYSQSSTVSAVKNPAAQGATIKWICTCGNVNPDYTKVCSCGVTKQQARKILAPPAPKPVVVEEPAIPDHPVRTANGWRCICGKEYPLYVSNCVCGGSKTDIK